MLAHATACHALAGMHYHSGQLSEAVADATAACDAGRFGWELYQPSARATLAEALLDRGELEAAAKALDVPDAEQRWGAGTRTSTFWPPVRGSRWSSAGRTMRSRRSAPVMP